jgi:hypothetical protein
MTPIEGEGRPAGRPQQIIHRSRPPYRAIRTGWLNIDLDHFAARVPQDALTEATADYWDRRAQQFEDAAPCKDDDRGRASHAELYDAWERCQNIARACKLHAALLRSLVPQDISDEVGVAIEEARRDDEAAGPRHDPRKDIDNLGFLGGTALVEIRGLLDGMPKAAPTVLDLGSICKVDMALIQIAPWANEIWSVEARDWQAAQQYVLDQSAVPGLVV